MTVLITVPLVVLIIGAWMIWRLRRRVEADDRLHLELSETICLQSAAFDDGEEIPTTFTCRGESASPPLHWADVPEGTRSLALLMTDEDLPSAGLRLFKIVHWVLYDVPPGTRALPANAGGEELQERRITVGRNWSRERAYAPPCPPLGRHRYVWRLYALDLESLEPEQDSRDEVLKAMQGHILAYGSLVGYDSG